MLRQYHGIASAALLLGLFPALFLPALQLIILIVLIGLCAAFRGIDKDVLGALKGWPFIALAQFCVFFFLNAALYPEWEGTRTHYRWVALESWSVTLVCAVILTLWLRMQDASDVKRGLMTWLPVGLSVSFALATLMYISSPQGTRIPLYTPSPLVPPFWFLVLAMTSFAWFSEMTPWQKIWRLCLFVMAGGMAIYGGARLVMLAWAVCTIALSIWFYMQAAQGRRFRVFLFVSVGITAGAGAMLLLDSLMGGFFMLRMRGLSQMNFTYDSVSAEFLRLRIWSGALCIISENAVLGVGQVNERFALNQELDWDKWYRAHQTYLSYLIIGGVPALVSGLLMQSLALIFVRSGLRDAYLPVFLGLGVVVTMNGLTDSIFQSAVSVQAFLTTTLLFVAARKASL